MACALPRDSSNVEDEPPAARPIHQSCQPAIRETSATLSDNLFVFLDRADVEATNYPAEQDIRIAVVNRKTCGGGNRTAKGAQAQSILMSVLQSCRHKGIRVIDIVTSILRAPDNTSPSPWSTQSGTQQLRRKKEAAPPLLEILLGTTALASLIRDGKTKSNGCGSFGTVGLACLIVVRAHLT